MQENHWQQIEQIFTRVVALLPAERRSFAIELCGDDIELRAEILQLIENDSRKDNFLNDPVFWLGAEILENDWLDLLKEKHFGEYRLKKLLGRGGMGAVYLAKDMRLGRLVAIKVLPFSFSENTNSVNLFRQEARTASGVSHPNIAHIYEFGEFGGRWFLAMEYVAGKTLRELINEKSLTETSSVNITRQITAALLEMHRRGIVHRDIKPENIVVTEAGAVKILDFGVAKLTDAEAENSVDTHNGSSEKIVGTMAYMSPEQISGQEIDARTDLWSLGVLWYEMISGKRPFESETASDLEQAVLSDKAAKLNSSLKIRRILNKLLQKKANDRYQNADELLEDLTKLQEKPTKIQSFVTTPQNTSLKVVFTLLLIAFISLLAIGFRSLNSNSEISKETAPIYSIAVLPFINETGSESNDYLTDGLTEFLIKKLSRLPNLTVTARGSVYKYKDQIVDACDVGEELSVQAVLVSRVTKQNDRLMLDLKIFDTQTGDQIWNKQYSYQSSNIIVLESDIAQDVSHNLRSRQTDADEQAPIKEHTKSSEAYELYLKGRYHWSKRTAKDLQKSIEYLEQAIALDPNFALAYAALADDYVLSSGYAISTPQESFPKAKEAARKALEIDRTLAEAHTALAYVLFNYEWNVAEAEKEIKLAIDLNPNYSTAHHWYGNAILLATGRFEEAIAELKLAQKLDPLSLIINADLGTTYLFARRIDESIAQLKKTVEMDDNFSYAHTYLGRAYLMKNSFDEAVKEFEKAQSSSSDPRILMLLVRTYSKSGEKDLALKALEKLKKTSEEKYVSPYYFALAYAGLGEKDQAFEWLEKAFQAREGRMTLMKVDPLMDEIRADPRFENLQRRVGF